MNSKALIKLVGIVLIAIAPYGCSTTGNLLALPEETAQSSAPVTSSSLSFDEHIQLLSKADVVYLGETHDSIEDHEAQIEIIEALHEINPNIAIAFEMFQHPFQASLDAYVNGTIDEQTLIAETEYENRWGFPWEFYAPMVRFAQTHQLPALALNAPSEIVRKVAQEGLDSLDESELQLIPPREEIDTTNENYQAYVGAVFGHGHHGGHSGMDFENFFSAQVVWDETMAENIANHLNDNPDDQVVVIAGQGHVMYGYGIPDRVARRVGSSVVQHKVLLNPSPGAVEQGEGVIADSFWFSED